MQSYLIWLLLFNVTSNLPECSNSFKASLESLEKIKMAIENVEKILGNTGRILVRYSGTENTCRVMVEGTKHKQVIQLAQGVAQAIREEIGIEGDKE